MTNASLNRLTVGFGLSVALMSLLNTLLVIVKDTNPPIKDAMKAASGHHWTTHGIIVIVLFIALGYGFSMVVKEEDWTPLRIGKYIAWSIILSGMALVGFYLTHLL
ncbi:MAG: hypothetical protein NT072_10170 [Deltaproteobacteria bacterium]|nr:hypothetical protein [Deltaproteobacteria bacterium]